MDAISPVLTDAFQLLRDDLYEHLSEAEFLATKVIEWSDEDVDAARILIPDLVLVIRGLLIEHQLTPHGTCCICTLEWPCPVVTRIHALVKDPEREFVALVRRAHADE
ncbi:MAG: hypothetical protein JO115_23755 [Pseudonocardiales bacterium]|nr:hypothetical protein [Pseudonocardiales bacterium]